MRCQVMAAVLAAVLAGGVLAAPDGIYWMETDSQKVKVRIQDNRVAEEWTFGKKAAEPSEQAAPQKPSGGFFSGIANLFAEPPEKKAAKAKLPEAATRIEAEVKKIAEVKDVVVLEKDGDIWLYVKLHGTASETKAKAIGEAAVRAGIRAFEGKIYMGPPPKTALSYFLSVADRNGTDIVDAFKTDKAEWIRW